MKLRTSRTYWFKGRINRWKYFLSAVSFIIILYCLMFGGAALFYWGSLGTMSEGRFDASGLLDFKIITGVLLVLGAFIFMFWVGTSLTVRRLHDMGLSGHHAWWITALMFLPNLAIIKFTENAQIPLGTLSWGINIWLLIARGTNGNNRYGPSTTSAESKPSNIFTALVASFCIGAAIQVYGLSRISEVQAWFARVVRSGMDIPSSADWTGSVRWTPFFGQDCGKLSYDVHGWEW